jgi:hypothetical protein
MGLGAENHNLGGLKTPNFAVRCPAKALPPRKYFQHVLRIPAGFRVKSAVRRHSGPRTAK